VGLSQTARPEQQLFQAFKLFAPMEGEQLGRDRTLHARDE
jgi:hypothetical protein